MSDLGFRISAFGRRLSDFGHRISDVRKLKADDRKLMTEVRCQKAEIPNPKANNIILLMKIKFLRYFPSILYPTKSVFSLLFLLVLWGCSVTKKLPAGESLYVGAKVNIQKDSVISKKESALVKTQIEALIKPKPNSAILGFPYKVWFYYLFGEPKGDKGFKAFFRKRFGEPPVLASKGIVQANAKQINLFLNNNGFFRSGASGSLVEKDRKATANYRVLLHQRYLIDSIQFNPQDTSAFGKAFLAAQNNSLLKQGTPYQFDLINAERERIDNQLKRRGFYYFRPDFIIIKADSSVGKHKVNLSFEVKPTTSQVAKKLYRIRDIHVISDYGEKSSTDSSEVEFNYRGLKIFDRTHSFRPKIFSDAIGFRRGGRYSSMTQDVSLSRLINLNGNFKFVKNTFELVPRSDSALLDVYYHLTPLKAKSLVADLNATTKSNNYTGSNISISWLNKNTFKGAELLKVTANAGLEFQVGGISSSIGAVNTTRFSIESNLSLPRFTIPFVSINPTRNQSLPKTNFNIGYEIMKRGGLYDLTSLRSSLSYAWKQNAAIEHSFTPLLVNLVKASNFSEDFALEYFRNPILYEEILDNKIIMSSAYTFSYMPPAKPSSRHTFSFTGGVELAGNLAKLLSNLMSEEGTSNTTVFGVTYPQYARFDADFRYAYRISQNVRLANRLLMGYGLPYGNSLFLPTVKQYVAGGNNSIRAFPARTIGPGSYLRTGSLLEQTIGGQSGDVKLELNTELRAKFNQYIHGAVFIDAGNVWMQHDVDVYGEDAVFRKDFYKQLAVGTGIGLRFDFSYLVMRFDLATPVRKPYLPENERWVLKDFNLGDAEWRRENLVLNIAVGYPF